MEASSRMKAIWTIRPPPGDDHRDALCGHRLPNDLGYWVWSSNRNYYIDYLEQRGKELRRDAAGIRTSSACEDAAVRDKELTITWLDLGIFAHKFSLMDSYPDGSVYSAGGQANAANWELLICSREEMMRRAREENGLRLYED
ncbi:hypothetical protein CSPAE12_01515 [Colletotrichum incanum]|nr:hypothetical protein CSPAE12_01515 [Colletotrichum incanum]